MLYSRHKIVTFTRMNNEYRLFLILIKLGGLAIRFKILKKVEAIEAFELHLIMLHNINNIYIRYKMNDQNIIELNLNIYKIGNTNDIVVS